MLVCYLHSLPWFSGEWDRVCRACDMRLLKTERRTRGESPAAAVQPGCRDSQTGGLAPSSLLFCVGKYGYFYGNTLFM